MAALESIRLLTIKGQTVGFDKVESDLGKVASAEKQLGDASAAAAQIMETSSRRQISAANALDRLSKQIDATYRAQQGMTRGQGVLDRALQQGLLSTEQYNQKLGQLQQRYTSLPQANDNLTRSLTQQIAAFTGLGGAVGNVSGIIGRFFPMLSGLATAAGMVNSVNLSARYETLGVVLHQVGKNAGYSAQEIDRYDASVQRSGITMTESRNTVTRMIQAHLDLSKSSQLARVAQDAAVIGDINSSQALERLVHGIQTAQTEVLRGIGINVSFEQSYATLARQIGKTAGDLTETEKTQARMNAVLQAGTQISGTYAASLDTPSKQLSSMKRIVEDMMVEAGQKLLPAYTLAVKGVGSALTMLAQNLDLAIAALATFGTYMAAPAIQGIGKSFLTAGGNVLSYVSALNTANFSLSAMTMRVRTLTMALATSPVAWITAIGAGLALWATHTDSATRAMEEHQRIIGAVREAYEAAGGAVDVWGTEIKNVTTLQIEAHMRQLQSEFQRSVQGLFAMSVTASTKMGQSDMFPQLSELLRQLDRGEIKIAEFQRRVNQLGSSDSFFRPLAVDILDASRRISELEKQLQEAVESLKVARGEADAMSNAVLGVGNSAARAAGQIGSFADAIKALQAYDPKLAAEQKITENVGKARSDLKNAYIEAIHESGEDSGAYSNFARRNEIVADASFRNAVDNITELRKQEEDLGKAIDKNNIDSLPEQSRKLAEVNQQFDARKKKIEEILSRPDADLGATQNLLRENEVQRERALANARRDIAEKAAKSADSRDDYDNMVRRMEDQTRKLQEQAATYGMAAEHVARYRAEQELLTAAQRAGRDLTPQLRAEIGGIADSYAEAAKRVEDLKKSQDAANQAIQGYAQLGYDLFDGFISGAKSFDQTINDLTKSIMKMVAQAALMGTGPFAGLMGLAPANGQSTGGLFGALGKMFPGGQYHNGGMVGYGGTPRMLNPLDFINAPRFHNGLRPDELPAILQRGEYVLSRADIAAINAGQTAASAPVAAASINGNRKSEPPVVNLYGAPEGTEVRQNDDGSLDIILQQNDRRMAADAARGRGPLAKTLQPQRHLRG